MKEHLQDWGSTAEVGIIEGELVTASVSYAEELAEVFYQAKLPDGRWKSIPQNAKDGYIRAMQAVLDKMENDHPDEEYKNVRY